MQWKIELSKWAHERGSEVSVHVVRKPSYAGEGLKIAGIIMVDWGSVCCVLCSDYVLCIEVVESRARCPARSTIRMDDNRSWVPGGALCRWWLLFRDTFTQKTFLSHPIKHNQNTIIKTVIFHLFIYNIISNNNLACKIHETRAFFVYVYTHLLSCNCIGTYFPISCCTR